MAALRLHVLGRILSKCHKMTCNFAYASLSTEAKEQTVVVDDFKINYVKVGNGPHSILCLPGALGSIWTDFKPQIEGLDREKFTVIGWDPPGYGKSRPPERQFSADFFHRDAEASVKLMKALGLSKFSLLGWSDGGITAIIAAAKHPDVINKLVIWGANSYIVPEEVKTYESIKDISKWSERMRAPMIAMYGEDHFRKLWSDWVDALVSLYHTQNGNICDECLPLIQCPTLVIHGQKDAMVAQEHPQHLMKHIKNARLHIFEDGKHNLHLKYAKEFNKLVEDFLTS